MSKTSITAGIFNFLDPNQGSGITNLGAVYTALPKVASEADLFAFVPAGSGVGAVIFLFIEDHKERRVAVGGPHSGAKFTVYTVSMLCILKSDLETSAAGQAQMDLFIDSLISRVRADRTAGGAVWQWGEGERPGAGGPEDLTFTYPVPKTLHGGVMLFQAVGRISALEYLVT